MPPMLTDRMTADFARDGLIRLPGLLPKERIEPVRDAVLRALADQRLRDGGAAPRPRWPKTGVKPAQDIGHRLPELAALFADAGLAEVVVALLGGAAIEPGLHRRPQILCSLPNEGEWRLPGGWHVDLPRLASGRSPGVQVFTFLDEVGPRGGGTLVVAGSHRLLNDRGALKMKEISRLLRRHDFFHALYADGGGAELPRGGVGDVALRAVELTGAPGDVWVTDLRLLHAAAPNARDRPRLMATHCYVLAELMPEIAAAFGWS